MNDLPTWANILIAILGLIGSGGLGAWFTNYVKSKKETDKDIGIEQNEQAVKIYKDLVIQLKKDIAELVDIRKKEHEEYILNREELIRYKLKEELEQE